MRHLIVTGPLESVRRFDPFRQGWPGCEVVRSSQVDPVDLMRSITSEHDIALLEDWQFDRDACAIVAVGTWLGLRFYRVEGRRLVACGPRDPVLEFVDSMTGVTV